jgi:hypothetical protein
LQEDIDNFYLLQQNDKRNIKNKQPPPHLEGLVNPYKGVSIPFVTSGAREPILLPYELYLKL